ncbi:MAG: MmgE/PrpD family protein [Pseudomonadales bacterium]|nr:MmgE/PrpD family protein [Pseudomonadales bacterium]
MRKVPVNKNNISSKEEKSSLAETSISEQIAQFVYELKWQQVPASVQLRAKLLILDAIGIGLAANRYPFASTINAGLVDLAALDGGVGDYHVLGSSQKLPIRDAIVANGALVHGLDFDDTHMQSVVHATAVSLPVAMSVGEATDANGTDMLSAYLAASEVAIRIGKSANFGFHDHGLHATGVAGHFSSAVAAAKLFGLSSEAIAAAQGIVGSTAMASQEFVGDGAWNKRFHPGWAGVAGLTAAKLAEHGFIAPRLPYEGRFGLFWSLLGSHDSAYDLTHMTDGLGTIWETEVSAVKPFPACHFTHAAADCALGLMTKYSIELDQIEKIVVLIPEGAVDVVAEPEAAKKHPKTDYDGKFSVQYVVAASLHRQKFGLAELDQACLQDAEILRTAAKVEYQIDPDSLFPQSYSGGVQVFMKSGKDYSLYEAVNRGAGARALSEAEVVDKFMGNAGLMVDEQKAESIRRLVMNLEGFSVRQLFAELCTD